MGICLIICSKWCLMIWGRCCNRGIFVEHLGVRNADFFDKAVRYNVFISFYFITDEHWCSGFDYLKIWYMNDLKSSQKRSNLEHSKWIHNEMTKVSFAGYYGDIRLWLTTYWSINMLCSTDLASEHHEMSNFIFIESEKVRNLSIWQIMHWSYNRCWRGFSNLIYVYLICYNWILSNCCFWCWFWQITIFHTFNFELNELNNMAS
jgi:hypothetical protein